MYDLAIIETGNGGDLQLSGNDFAYVTGIENMPYLASFGGNPGYVTKSKIDTEQSFDFWGNYLFHHDKPELQFNSLVEQKLKEIVLNSQGRIDIENTFKKDLSFLSKYATIEVLAQIVSDDHLRISIKIIQKYGGNLVKIINFRKKVEGDFYFSDFSDDFYVG